MLSRELTELYSPLVTRNPPNLQRSPGLHVSGLIRAAAIDQGLLDDDIDQQGHQLTTNHVPLRVIIGSAWDEHIDRRIAGPSGLRGTYRPAEWGCPLDDTNPHSEVVYSSPDGFTGWRVHGYYIIHEFKLTWKSQRMQLAHQWMWLSQCMCYVYTQRHPKRYTRMALTSPQIEIREQFETNHNVPTVVNLHVTHVNGDYRDGVRTDPIYQCFELKFTDQELQENWNLLRGYAGKAKREGTVQA